MRAYRLGVGFLCLLSGCSADWSQASLHSARSAKAKDGILDKSLPMMSHRVPSKFAALRDTGDLVVYDLSARSVQRGAYTWHPVLLSEEHALRAAVNGEMVVTGPNGQPIRLKVDRHIEHPDGNWTWIGREPGTAPGTEAIITFGAKAVY